MIDLEYLKSVSEKLGSGEEETRYHAVKELSKIGLAGAIPLLMEAVGDSSYRIRENALKAICGFPSEIIFPRLESNLRDNENAGLRTAAMEAFQRYGRVATPFLLGLLKDFDEEIRTFSAVMLGEIADPSSINTLLQALNDPDVNVKHAAAESLGKIRDPRAVEPLIHCLDQDFWVQYPAVVALGNIGDSRATEPLLNLLGNEMLRQAVIEAMGKIGDISVVPVLAALLMQDDPTVINDSIASLVNIQSNVERHVTTDGVCLPSIRNALNDADLIEHLLKSLDNPNHEVKKNAIIALGWLKKKQAVKKLVESLNNYELEEYVVASLVSIGHEAIPELIINLENSDPKIKISLLRCIGWIEDVDSIRACIPLLRDNSDEVRCQAVFTMVAAVESEDVEEALLSIIREENQDIRMALIDVLGKSLSTRITRKIVEKLLEQDKRVKITALQILARLKDQSACAAVEKLLENDNEEVKAEVYKTLGQILPGEISSEILVKGLLDASPIIRKAAITSLKQSSQSDIQKNLLLMLNDSDPDVCLLALEALGKMGNVSSIKGLISACNNGDRRLKLAVIKTMSNLNDKDCIQFLNEFLKESDPDLKRAAIESLGKIGDKRSFPNLIIALNDSDWSIRAAAITALGRIGDKRCAPYIISMLEEDDDIIRKCSIAALADLGSEEAVNHILPFIHINNLQLEVTSAIGKLGIHDICFYYDFLKKSNSRLKCVLVEILGKPGHREAVNYLANILEDEFFTVRRCAARALGELGDRKAIPKLIKANKDDPSEEVRREAALALKKLDANK